MYMYWHTKQTHRGFTLIELLVVIAIIGILASVVFLGLSESRARARDAERLSDLKQIQTGLELYYAQNKEYPSTLSALEPYLDNVPADPLRSRAGTSDEYQYQISADGDDYGIAALSESGDEETWCRYRSNGSTIFDSYQTCPF